MTGPLTIRWDESMGCYRVSEPNFAQDDPVRVFREEDVRKLWDALQDVLFTAGLTAATWPAVIIAPALDAFPAPEKWTA